jgi:hypothetical protein
LRRFGGRPLPPPEAEGDPDIGRVQKLLGAFKLEHFEELVVVKQKGFYVSLTGRGDLVSPDIDSFPSQLLLELGAFLITSLKSE